MHNKHDAPRQKHHRNGHERQAREDTGDRFAYRQDHDPHYRTDYGQRQYMGSQYGNYEPPRDYADDRFDYANQYAGNASASDYDRSRSRNPAYFGDQTRAGNWRDGSTRYGYQFETPRRDERGDESNYAQNQDYGRYQGGNERAGRRGPGSGYAYAGNEDYAQREDAFGRSVSGPYRDQYEPRSGQYAGESQRGRGPKNYTRSDERIREDINEALYHDHHIDASDINVDVKHGVVTLTGSVKERIAKYRTEDIADRCSGVKDVENRLSVQRPDRHPLSASAGKPAEEGKKH